MTTNTANTSTINSNSGVAATIQHSRIEAPFIDNVPDSPAAHFDVANAAINLIYSASRSLSIAEAEDVMDSLDTLGMCIMDMILSRIPQDSLAKVEGKYYLTATVEQPHSGKEGDTEAVASKYREILAASPLAALEGYAAQTLAKAEQEEARLSSLMADPLWSDDDDTAAELARATQHREQLAHALKELREAVATHGGETVAGAVVLHPATIDALFSVL